MSKQGICKYCGTKTTRADCCHTCGDKLKLIRKILRMVWEAKEDVKSGDKQCQT